ncbi:hypothetical protein LEP1GSC058_1615 [Leptospira fainei serovar Hurstbridge str. BUT 6]|uniref:Exo-alpha-sialidase n=1 Tax=Leptospira fainei serovar Hurstbridge str. BUT 6 TaxID=1193011 RepID=S3UXC8_9LEPT|nr:hypothetical protein [Leptospira fainei]EPG75011.1 hypothetical protein LEP1GSC058_1615 [Leptospira fainei serovar Hurstbridge str. BUT 6]
MKFQENSLDPSSPSGFLFSLLSSESLYVAVGANCTSWTSRDGTNWNVQPNTLFPNCTGSGGATINAVAYGNGKFVAVGSLTSGTAGCGIWSSTDGRKWIQSTCGGGMATPLHSVAYNGSNFVAGAEDNYPTFATHFIQQSDATASTWTQVSFGATAINGFVSSVISVGGTYYATISTVDSFTSSNNGGTWSQFSSSLTSLGAYASSTSSPLKITAGSGSRLIVYGTSSTFIPDWSYTDDLGVTWTTRTSTAGANTGFNAAVYNPVSSFFVALGTTCLLGLSSTGGTNMDPPTNMQSGCSTTTWNALVVNPKSGLLVAAGTNENFAYSPLLGAPGSWTISTTGNTNTVNSIALRP